MRKKLKLKGPNKEAPKEVTAAQEEPEAQPAGAEPPSAGGGAPKDEAPPAGKPEDPPSFSGDGTPDPAEDTVEPTLADDKRAGAVDPETGEPRICDGKAALITGDPSDHSPEDVGAAIIKGLDHLALCMTPEVRTRQSELFHVFQLYAAERPSILERQKRLQLRRNQG